MAELHDREAARIFIHANFPKAILLPSEKGSGHPRYRMGCPVSGEELTSVRCQDCRNLFNEKIFLLLAELF